MDAIDLQIKLSFVTRELEEKTALLDTLRATLVKAVEDSNDVAEHNATLKKVQSLLMERVAEAQAEAETYLKQKSEIGAENNRLHGVVHDLRQQLEIANKALHTRQASRPSVFMELATLVCDVSVPGGDMPRCSCMTRYSSPSAPLHFEAERSAKQLAASGSVVRSPAGTSSSTGVPCGDDDECSPAQPLPSRSAVSSSVVDPEAMSLEQYCDALKVAREAFKMSNIQHDLEMRSARARIEQLEDHLRRLLSPASDLNTTDGSVRTVTPSGAMLLPHMESPGQKMLAPAYQPPYVGKQYGSSAAMPEFESKSARPPSAGLQIVVPPRPLSRSSAQHLQQLAQQQAQQQQAAQQAQAWYEEDEEEHRDGSAPGLQRRHTYSTGLLASLLKPIASVVRAAAGGGSHDFSRPHRVLQV